MNCHRQPFGDRQRRGRQVPATKGPVAQKGGWAIVALLFFFMMINFADKAIIGLAGVPIMKELNLTPKEFGLVNSSFFFLFSLSAIVTGFIVNHVQSRWVLLAMAVIWSLTQFPMIGTVSLATLLACRIVLGAAKDPPTRWRFTPSTSGFPTNFVPCRLRSLHKALQSALFSPSRSSTTSSSAFPGIGPLACWESSVLYG